MKTILILIMGFSVMACSTNRVEDLNTPESFERRMAEMKRLQSRNYMHRTQASRERDYKNFADNYGKSIIRVREIDAQGNSKPYTIIIEND